MTTESLTEAQWQITHNIAINLVKSDTDVNELGKAIAYFRSIINQPNAGKTFFIYLKTLVTNGKQISHSNKTPIYYRNIEKACKEYLQTEIGNAQTTLEILGWAARLMHYYKASPIEEITTSPIEKPKPESARQAEITQVTSKYQFTIDQILDAIVLSVKGNKVTYQMLDTIKLTEKEPKKADSLKDGQQIKVKITAIKEDGSIKSVKCT